LVSLLVLCNDDTKGKPRKALPAGKAAAHGNERVELFRRATKEISVAVGGPPHTRNGARVVSHQQTGKLPPISVRLNGTGLA